MTSLQDLLTRDIFDTRDLEQLLDSLRANAEQGDEDAAEELASASTFAAELSDCAPDYEYGETVISDAYFEDYARQLAEDVGAIEEAGKWPTYCIDWAWAARELQMDYSAVRAPDGSAWWVR